ncbi:hypothetical protein ACFL5Q_06395 [Planctomycetota bacterium]
MSTKFWYMSWRERSGQTARSRCGWRSRRIVFAGVAVLSIVALLLFGRAILSWWARQMALGRMDAGAISEAQPWLARSARFDPHDGKTELMKAACFRRLYRQDGWNKALESAERKGVSAAEIGHAQEGEAEFRGGD